MADLLSLVLAGNPVSAWITASTWILGAILVMAVLRPMAIAWLEANQRFSGTVPGEALVRALKQIRWPLIALMALMPASQVLELAPRAESWMLGAATFGLVLQAGLLASTFLDFWIRNARNRALQTDPSTATGLAVVSFMARLVLWSLLLLLLLDNLGFDVNALVAGLGIGGIAIGLAVQNVLGDLFASLSIVLDKPFEIGHFVVIDNYSGTIEYIGLKTTRIRSLSGEMLVFSNADLVAARLRNFKLMNERRIVFTFGVEYGSTPEQIEQVPGLVRELIDAQPLARFDRAHFHSFGASSLDFEVVYWMTVPDYGAYMDTQQAINLGLMRRLSEIGVEFAYPTQTLKLQADQPIPLQISRHHAPNDSRH